MCERGTSRVMALPEWWSDYRSNQDVCIDSCIADTLQGLWDRGVVTLGCCCGHGGARSSIVLSQDREMSSKCRRALSEIGDTRDWELLQWQLVDVTDEVSP